MAEVLQIDPNTLQPQVFSPKDDTIIPSFEIESLFNPEGSKVEFFIYDLNNNLLTSDYNYRNWRTIDDPSLAKTGEISTMEVKPSEDVVQYGFDTGEVNTIYNFTNYQLDSSPDNLYYISDISANRTELRLKTNIFESAQIESTFREFELNVLDADYFDEFYINFGNNNLYIAVNAQLDETLEDTSILIKLYEPLPTQYVVKDEIYVVTKVAESVGYQVTFDEVIEVFDDLTYLKGPNTSLDLNAQTNNSSEYKSYSELQATPLSSSFYQLKQIANQKGINLNVDYTSYSNFTYFSSAKTRLENFYYKAKLIETYQYSQSIIENYNPTLTPSTQISGSGGVYKSKIEDIIKNFDGYDYFLYYNSESKAWPKQNSTQPYILASYSGSTVKTWLGSDNENSAYYGGELLSGSNFDNENQNNLFYTIPEFIREDTDNNPYRLFINMMGQHFDNLWLYTKQVTEKLDRDNRVAYGISKDLVADTLRSLGTKLYGGGFAVEDIYTNFLGFNTSGSLSPPTGSELITNYITASGDAVPLGDAHKELYKRLYNNLPHLLKKKGTIEGIRNLITIYGIPQTILRISEFGGKDKYNYNDYDYSYDRYSYALKTQMSASALIPWKPLVNTLGGSTTAYVDTDYWEILYTEDSGGDTSSGYDFPNSIQFRFKTEGRPTNTRYSQSIFVKKNPTIEATADSQSFDFGVFLTYDPSVLDTGSYSGSVPSAYKDYGNLEFIISGSTYASCSVYLPFYDGKWWSGMVTRNINDRVVGPRDTTDYFTLYAGNNIYNGPDGDKIGFYSTSTLSTTYGNSWINYHATSSGKDGVWYGGYISGSVVGVKTYHPSNTIFSGSLQEFRYSNHVLGPGVFKDFVMNPESIEGIGISGTGSSFEVINFRAPFGNELFELTSSNISYHTHSLKSMHPAVTASAPSQIVPSFIYSGSGGFTSSSLYRVIWEGDNPTGSYADKHTETYYLDQPVAGLKNRSTDKIRIENNTIFENVLSNQVSIQQSPIISQSYMRDVNILEVAFSPQNEINDDIIQTYGYFSLADYIGDPRFVSSSARTYPDLDVLQREYFKKYYKQYNIFDYVRLIKYFDNSLFKMIKDYVPARTALNTGVVIKQHMLERNRQRPAQMSYIQPEYTSSISVATFSGSAGGSVNQYNTGSFNQSWTQSIATPSGSVIQIHDSQEEFYNGEYDGSYVLVTTQSLNEANTYKSTGVGTMSIPSGSVNLPFDLSPYDVLDNNVTGSTKDDLIQVVDYLTAATFPSNYTAILSGSAEKAQVNKSFFTTKANIDPRYDGCELTSTDYNNYTAGDVSYGSTAVIDKHPTYFAHFSKGIYTLESLNEVVFTLDYLIPSDANVPENISSIGEIPGVLRIKGDGAYQYITSNNFEHGRRCSVDFVKDIVQYSKMENGNFYQDYFQLIESTGSNKFEVNWGGVENQSYPIVQGGAEYATLASNQVGYSNNSFTNGIWFHYSSSTSYGWAQQFKYDPSSYNLHAFIETGSGFLSLMGDAYTNTGTPAFNKYFLSELYEISFQKRYFGFAEEAYKFNANSSGSFFGIEFNHRGFTDFNLPFIPEKGDEILLRSSSKEIVKFTLTSPFFDSGGDPPYVTGSVGLAKYPYSASCFPNPQDYDFPISSSFTIRRKMSQDNKVILKMPILNNVLGDLTPSSDGYLIPEDFTQENRDKVGKLIAVLKGNNVFT